MKTTLPKSQLALRGLGATLALILVEACFRAYLDPALVVTMTSGIFLCR